MLALSMNTPRIGLLLILVCAPATANAQDLKDRFNLKLSLTGFYSTEQQDASAPELRNAAPFSLGYGELRAALDARRLPGKFELHLDARVRISGEFSTDAASQGANQIVARGYLGGREYQLNPTWVRRRGDRVDFAFGRLVVAESDALRIDGARLWWRMAKHWDASAFAGAYPDPFSRSLLTDYTAGFAFAGGADASYTYDRVWGSFSVVGSYLGGNDDGGPFNPASPTGNPQTETPRAYFTWTSFERFTSWLDVYHDLVVDFVGAAGAQLTRLDLFATARAGRFVTIRLGYDHLSALAIEMWLTRLLASRPDFALTQTIENNLTVQRTARDEGRAQVDVTIAKVSIFGEGRIRRRAIVDLKDDPQFENAGQQVAPDLAFDTTLGVRDRGSLAGVRIGAWYTYLGDYRARSHVAALELGRSFLDELLTADVSFLYASTRDAGAGAGAPCNPALPTFNALGACFGSRDGDEYELGITLTANPWKRWFGLVDYRMVIDTANNGPAKALTTHMLLLRLEVRI
jgi:hypothetical protein